MQAPAGGPPEVRAQGRKGDDGSHKACPPPPPLQRDGCRASCLRRACVVPVTCVQRREGDKPPPPPHTSAPPRVGDEGREGRTAAPPPEDKAARWGGSGGRVRDGPHDRARRKHVPCKPQRGGAPGERTQREKGDDGSHAACPSPLQRDKCRASCLRRACDVLTPEEGQRGRPPPPPPPSPPPTKERGEGSEEEARGHGGGTEDRPTCQGKRRAASG